ncbi:MAG: hypothetical protein H6714_00455 [Myxococcales bacterium]|nr:hypothetical protein [Myxococcales bacterium]
MELERVFKELNAWIAEKNQEFSEEGVLTLPRCTIRVLGQTALLEAGTDLPLAATKDVDVYADYEHVVQVKFEELLRARGKLLDPIGHEAWMPKETKYLTVFDGSHVKGQIAAPEYVLLSKALKAPEKNRALIVEYLSSGPSELFLQLAEKYRLDLGRFVR